jgi:hypothetical protein
MMNLKPVTMAAFACLALSITGKPVQALPFVPSPAIAESAELPILKTQAQRRAVAPVRPMRPPAPQQRRRSNNNAVGAAVAAGVLGVIAGGIIASQAQPNVVYRSYPEPNYYPPQAYPAYGAAPVTYAPPPRSPAWYDYCSRRYRSFDPRSGTFLGYDGIRYFCQ